MDFISINVPVFSFNPRIIRSFLFITRLSCVNKNIAATSTSYFNAIIAICVQVYSLSLYI